MKISKNLIFSFVFNTLSIFSYIPSAYADESYETEEDKTISFDEDNAEDAEELLYRLRREAKEAEQQLHMQEEEAEFENFVTSKNIKDPAQLEAFRKKFAHHKQDSQKAFERKKSYWASLSACLAAISGMTFFFIMPYRKKVDRYMEELEIKNLITDAKNEFDKDASAYAYAAAKKLSEDNAKKITNTTNTIKTAALEKGIGESNVKKIYKETVIQKGYEKHVLAKRAVKSILERWIDQLCSMFFSV